MEKLVDKLKNILEKNYFKKDEHGSYFLEITADYRDVLPGDTIRQIINANDPVAEYNEILYETDFDAYEFEVLYELIERELGKDMYAKHMNKIRDWIIENVYFEPPTSHYDSQEVLVNLIVDTGDGNYDYTCNNLLNYCAPKIEDLEIMEESSILWLIKQQGYTKKDLLDVVANKHDHNNKFLESVQDELLNPTTSMNALTFFFEMQLGSLINYLNNPTDVVLSKDTSCGLVDFWNGAGSILEINLEKNVIIPKKYIRMDVDGNTGYSVQEIYGMCGSFWSNSFHLTVPVVDTSMPV